MRKTPLHGGRRAAGPRRRTQLPYTWTPVTYTWSQSRTRHTPNHQETSWTSGPNHATSLTPNPSRSSQCRGARARVLAAGIGNCWRWSGSRLRCVLPSTLREVGNSNLTCAARERTRDDKQAIGVRMHAMCTRSAHRPHISTSHVLSQVLTFSEVCVFPVRYV